MTPPGGIQRPKRNGWGAPMTERTRDQLNDAADALEFLREVALVILAGLLLGWGVDWDMLLPWS